ncbi:MAG: glycosyltransferase [Butyrivibrio sp.]|jgi:glycosyltransferase involved in cell wall biosynthesis|nr:glycosyltransferase [Butyrivibrio sp.]
MEKLISVIVPVYNVQNYLTDCVNSIVTQTYHNLQIILIDDGSTDKSGIICDQLQQTDARIEVIHKKNGGLSAARNSGLEIADGEYISFVDSDDMLRNIFYSRMSEVIEKENADLVVCRAGIFHTNSDIQAAEPLSEHYEILDQDALLNHFMDRYTGQIGWAWNKLYKHNLIGDTRFEPNAIMEDIMFSAEIAVKVQKAVWLTDKLNLYRLRESSIMSAGNADITLPYLHSLEHVVDTFKDHNCKFSRQYTSYALKEMANCLGISATKGFKQSVSIGHKQFEQFYNLHHSDIDNYQDLIKIATAKYCFPLYTCFKMYKIKYSTLKKLHT